VAGPGHRSPFSMLVRIFAHERDTTLAKTTSEGRAWHDVYLETVESWILQRALHQPLGRERLNFNPQLNPLLNQPLSETGQGVTVVISHR
jgi:hypothetical protein